jgi:dolichol-phosphate mannosyltransferase
MKISVVVPTRNEEKNIEQFLSTLQDYEVILADSSTDDTGKIASKFTNVTVIELNKQGKGHGVKKGIENAEGVIVLVDGDGSYPASYIPKLLNELKNSDIAIGSRYMGGSVIHDASLHRKLAGRTYSSLFRLFFGVLDPQSGLKVFRKETVRKIGEIDENGFSWDSIFIARARRKGMKIKEIPIAFTAKEKTTKVHLFGTSMQLFMTLLKLVFYLI